jgi:2'-5' RNA ligase
MKRLFFALPIPKDAVRKIEKYIAPFKADPLFSTAKWVTPENYHLTLLFLGEIGDNLIPEVRQLARAVFNQMTPFQLVLNKVLLFPPVENAHMVWLRGPQNLSFEEAKSQLNRFLFPCLADKEKDTDEPIPHLTLCRLKDPVAKKAITFPPLLLDRLEINECHLYESTLTPSGPVYTLVEEYKFCS